MNILQITGCTINYEPWGKGEIWGGAKIFLSVCFGKLRGGGGQGLMASREGGNFWHETKIKILK